MPGDDQSVHLNKGDQEKSLTQQQIQRMINYLTENTDYKILTSEEYNMMQPSAHSTPVRSTESGARPKEPQRTVKFENPPQPQNQMPMDSHTSLVYDATSVRPRFTNFSGEEKSDTSFEVWKNDVKCAIQDGSASTSMILQAIRSSLKGKARSLLLTLPMDATPDHILQKLDGVYGNIYPSEKLIQQFYEAKQHEGESVADYGMRLENLLQTCIERRTINSDSRNEMLRTKLWSGLSDISLRNASRYKYDTIHDFETLRRELRTIELDMKTSSSTSGSATMDKKKSQVSKIGEKPDTDTSLDAILKKLEQMDKRMVEVEREVRSLRSNNGWNDSNSRSGQRDFRRSENRGRGNKGRGNSSHTGNTYKHYRDNRQNRDADLNE